MIDGWIDRSGLRAQYAEIKRCCVRGRSNRLPVRPCMHEGIGWFERAVPTE